MKKVFMELTEKSGVDALLAHYNGADCIDDNEKYLIGTIMLERDMVVYGSKTDITYVISSCNDGVYNLTQLANGESLGAFIMDDMAAADRFRDALVERMREYPFMPEFWDSVVEIWESM